MIKMIVRTGFGQTSIVNFAAKLISLDEVKSVKTDLISGTWSVIVVYNKHDGCDNVLDKLAEISGYIEEIRFEKD